MDLYIRYQPKKESNKLNYIAYSELGEKKLSYDGHTNLHKLLSTKSKDVVVSAEKPNDELEEFEKWVRLKDKLKKLKK
jgi:hypothetical protein